ncbi:MAG TPA: hypothetical protein VE224_01485 [Pseudolabrys sp.]|nr:hypothetical protein [Pseudolabrys sp.]
MIRLSFEGIHTANGVGAPPLQPAFSNILTVRGNLSSIMPGNAPSIMVRITGAVTGG